MRLPDFKQMIEHWNALNLYEKLEQVLCILLSIIIMIVAVFAILRLLITVFELMILGADFTQFRIFQKVFGMIMTVLIALEFNHTVTQIVRKQSSIVQARVVVLIGVLLIIRKFVLIDFVQTEPDTVIALAVLLAALGALYWLIRDADRRQEPAAGGSGDGAP